VVWHLSFSRFTFGRFTFGRLSFVFAKASFGRWIYLKSWVMGHHWFSLRVFSLVGFEAFGQHLEGEVRSWTFGLQCDGAYNSSSCEPRLASWRRRDGLALSELLEFAFQVFSRQRCVC